MKLNSKHLFCHFFTILTLSFLFIVGANAEEYRYDVPYINQLDYPEWGQSACGPTSIAMTLRYWYSNSLIDVPEVYHAATQGSSGAPLAYYQDANTGAPLPGYYNVGYATTNVWQGTEPDTAKERVPEEFREFHKNNYSGMVKDYAVSYLRNIWDGVVNIKNQTMTNIINEIVHRPVILNVNEGYGGHFVVLRGYDDSGTEELSDDYFYINDPYPPYADGGTGPFDTTTTSANNRKITYETLLGWTSGRDMITFQPSTIHTNVVREYTVIVDNGIANWDDDGILNSNCNGQSHCFQVDDVNASNDDGYIWLCYHTTGMDWIYPTEDGHPVQWTPQLAKDGYYDLYVKFFGDSTQSTVQYDIYDSFGNILGTRTVNQNVSGYESVLLGQYYLANGAYVRVANMPAYCNADAVMFRYVPDPKSIDVALIIDSSGSMGWNDPQDLRKEAAKIFVDTAQNNDQIAIVDFDSWSYLRWPLQPLTENRDSIKSAVDLINSSGGTSLSAGLLEGYNQLNSSTQPYKKAAVFLTDGMGYYNNEAELYKNEGNDNDCWPIYTIGLGYSTNPTLLQSIADTTGGKYFALTDPNQLQNVYFEIATQISGGNVLASESSVMSTGDTYIASVAVPAGQQSATFLTTWPGSDVNTTLTSPSGSEITPATIDPNIYYAKGLTYELYRITNPEAGSWEVTLYGADLASGGETVNISVSSVGPPVPQDTSPPVITISNPIGGKIYFDQMPTIFSFAVEDLETAISSQTALLNGSPINNNDNILLTQLGENVLTITATNEANLTSELSITFYVNHFSWLPPIRYQKGSATETLTSVIQANSTLPLKFAIFDANSSFVEDTTVKVVVEGTTAQFTYGEGDTNIRINQEEGEEPLYIVNIHTNFNKCDYGLEEGNEYNLTVYFNDILAASTKLRIE